MTDNNYYFWPKNQYGDPCRMELLYKIEKYRALHYQTDPATKDTWRPPKKGDESDG